jgi:DnaJ-class molecular chaperone
MNYDIDLYKILGINKNSSLDDIKSAYKRLAKKHHPDMGGDAEKFKELVSAYTILKDASKKIEYDNVSVHGQLYNKFANSADYIKDVKIDFTDFKEDLNITVNIIVTIKEVYIGKPITVKYDRYVHCADCDGTGFDRTTELYYDCEICEGEDKQCPYCFGTNKIFSDICKKCNGDKIILTETKFNLNNIQNIRKTNEKYIKSYGHQSRYYRNKIGSLTINIIYQNIDNYKIVDDNLYYFAKIHHKDAISGIVYNLKTLNDKNLKINIPENTKDGDIIIVEYQGLKTAETRGSLYFKIKLINDKN